jgi:5-methylthioadenosine/S-adenosylhomocysteine deaminase
MDTLLIRNTQVFSVSKTGDRVDIQPRQDVLINGQRIEAVQPTGSADSSHFDTVIDAAGMLVMAGLINCHAHLPMVLWRGLAEDASVERWFNDRCGPSKTTSSRKMSTGGCCWG